MYLYTLGTHPDLEKQVMLKTGLKPGSFQDKVFKNGEYFVKVDQDVSGKKVAILSVIIDPCEEIFRLLFLLNALKSNKASRVSLVLPYYPYSRQDRVSHPGEPISAELIAAITAAAGADRIISVDIHNPRGLGKYKRKLQNIKPYEIMASALEKTIDSSWVLVAPDKGAEKRVRELARVLKIKKTAYLKKERPRPGEAKITDISGDQVNAEKTLIVDDMIDSGGTLIEAANFIRQRGAKMISAVCTHGIFSNDALKRINRSVIKNVYCSDTLPIIKKDSGKLIIIPINSLVAKAIKKNV